MYCEIYPIKRLPRRFDVFDYKIPDGMKVNVGDLVRIPFRKQHLFGIVTSVKKTSSFPRLSPVKEVIRPAFISSNSVKRFESIAELIVQAPSTIFHFAFADYRARKKLPEPPLSPKAESGSLSSDQIKYIKQALTLQKGSCHVQLGAEEVIGLVLASSKQQGQTLVLCPDARYAEQLSHFGMLQTAVLHGKTPAPQRERILNAWRRGSIQTLIGTRQVSLLEPQTLQRVIICESASDDYRFIDRNPRFDARMAAEALAKQFDAPCLFTSPFPFAHNFDESIIKKDAEVSVITLGTEGERTSTPFLSKQLKSAIDELPREKKALLFFHRKGGAKQMQCSDCGYTVLCGTCHHIARVRKDDLICDGCSAEMYIPSNCPSCQSHKLSAKGLGNQQIKQQFQKAFPTLNIGIVDKDQQELNADILIATEYYFKQVWTPFLTPKFGIVAELHFEQQIYDDSFHAMEYAGYALHRLIHLAKQQKADAYFQVWEKDAITPLLNPSTWLSYELAMRKRYELPPYGYHATIRHSEAKKDQIARANAKTLEKTLEDLKKLPDSAIITAESSYIDHHVTSNDS